jgi:class 3 adenylate cyclase/tetratricopeptide (TPR) repeat protein
MMCLKCQIDNKTDAKVCLECGEKLKLQCPQCGKYLPIAAKFCDECGQRSGNTVEGTIEPELKEERKHVTVLFSDVSGYSAMTERLDPEDVRNIMSRIFGEIVQIIYKYEGFIERIIGDAVMAVFGLPRVHEDDSVRAIRAAKEIHYLVENMSSEFEEKVGQPLSMHTGINTGLVVTGEVDLQKGTHGLTGDAINLASRLESLAKRGEVLVGENTFRQAEGYFTFESLEPIRVKGKTKPVRIHKLLDPKEHIRSHLYRPRLGLERRIYSEMVGRDTPLEQLELQVMKVINGEGSIVNIIGEAGIGKSRLVAELKKREEMKRVSLLEGRAISIGRNLGFHPIADLLRQWARIREDDGAGRAFDKLEAAVRSICPEEVGEILPFVATLMGMKLSGRYAERVKGIEGEALEKLILKNVRELLIKTTELTPQIIVVEDLHWADTTSIELIKSLFRLAETQRIVFVNVFRPGYEETGDRIIEYIKERLPQYYVEITLEPLDKRMSEALIANMVNISGFHYTIVEQILQRSGGNPFFIEEVVRSLIDRGAIVFKNGTFEITEKIRTMTIPHTINHVLISRIDRIEEETRNLLKIASVIGRNFFYRILTDVASTIEDIDGQLAVLKKAELIQEHERMGELEYLFKHALAQEAVYESILLDKRKNLHLRVARSIEKVLSERLHEFYGMLAYHYSKAEDLEKTEEYLVKAGDKALKASASNEALHYFQEALALYLKAYDKVADPEKVAMFEKNIALAFYNRGQYVEAIEYFDKALNYYWKKVPKHQISIIYQFVSGFFHFFVSLYLPFLKFGRTPTQRDREAVDLFFKKLKALPIVDPKRFFLESFPYYKGITRFDLTKFDLGIGLFVSASNLFSFTGISFGLSRKILEFVKDEVDRNDVKSFTVYDFSETLHNYLEGNWKTVEEYDVDLVNKNLNMGETYWASQHVFWHACPKLFQGYLDISKLLVDKLNDISEIYENDLSIMLKYLLNTSLLTERRKLHSALIESEKGIDFVQKMGQGQPLIHLFAYNARIHILMGNIEEAQKSLEHANEITGEVSTVPWQRSSFFRGQLEYDLYLLKESMRNGDRKKSFEYRKKAIKSCKMMLKQSKKVAEHRTESYRLMGIYYWVIKSQKRALKWWNKAITEGERLGARLELSRTYFEVGKRLLEPESKHKELNGIKAEKYLDKARILFEEMDLQWDLDELNRLASPTLDSSLT